MLRGFGVDASVLSAFGCQGHASREGAEKVAFARGCSACFGAVLSLGDPRGKLGVASLDRVCFRTCVAIQGA